MSSFLKLFNRAIAGFNIFVLNDSTLFLPMRFTSASLYMCVSTDLPFFEREGKACGTSTWRRKRALQFFSRNFGEAGVLEPLASRDVMSPVKTQLSGWWRDSMDLLATVECFASRGFLQEQKMLWRKLRRCMHSLQTCTRAKVCQWAQYGSFGRFYGNRRGLSV